MLPPELHERLSRLLAKPFHPPFVGLPVVIWLYYVACFVFHPQSGIMHGRLPDVDDYMFLDHIRDWLHGQGWYDVIEYRLAPPEGVFIHFSRLTEVPIAALLLLFRALGFNEPDAAIAAATVLPPLYLGILFGVLRWIATCVMPRDWSRTTAYTALFSGYLLFLYSPGHIDHHGLANILVALALGCVMRIFLSPETLRWSVGAGCLLALAMAIALETLPWLLALTLYLGLWLLIEGRIAARAAAVFGVSLFLAAIPLLMLYRPPSEWLATDTRIFSIVYVILAGSIALCFTGTAAIAKTRFCGLRYAAAPVLGCAAITIFLKYFPELMAGPYGGMDKRWAATIFDNISEALPLIRAGSGLELIMPLIALDASVTYASRAEGRLRWVWWLNVFLLTAALLLGLLYQSRCLTYGYLFGIVPLAALLQRGWEKIAIRYCGRARFAAELGLLLLVGPLPWVLTQAWFDHRPINPGMVMFPVDADDTRCALDDLSRVLNSPDFYRGRPLTIVNLMGSGSELLFRTPHNVLAAPYFNIRGNLDAVGFFSTTDPVAAEAIVRRNRVDLVAFCHLVPGIYYGHGGPHQPILDVADQSTPPGDSFIEQISAGRTPPWLTRIPRDDIGPFLLFRVNF